MEIDVLIESAHWNVLDIEALTRAAVRSTLTELDLKPVGFALSVLATDDGRIAILNADFRGKALPTNVLSWPSEERGAAAPGEMPILPETNLNGPPEELGDIAIAFETCAREAEEGEKTLADHTTHLIVHGLMHCLGFDHETEADAALMENLETRILATLGVADPY